MKPEQTKIDTRTILYNYWYRKTTRNDGKYWGDGSKEILKIKDKEK